MKHGLLSLMLSIALPACLVATLAGEQRKKAATWNSVFTVDRSELSATGRNPYFILEPGYQLVFEGGRERLVITVLDDLKTVDGVETRVVEERETRGGKLIEVSRNYFAISGRSKDVFYFGEDVDNYRSERIVNHEGSWLAGLKDARFGLMMPGQALPGLGHYQEFAPRVALDRAVIVSVNETVRTPAGEFKDCLKIEETTPLEPGVKEYKYYASGIGLVQDGALKLVKYGRR